MILLLTGVMASGKSTVAELLAEKLTPAVHLRGDLFRRMIVSGRAEMADPPTPEALRQLELRYRLTAQAAKTYHKAGFHVIVQDNYYGPQLPHMLELLRPLPVETVVLCPDVETVKMREEQRNKTGYTGFTVETLYQAFLAETPRIGHWIDSSIQTPEETAQQILRLILPHSPAPGE